MIINSQLHANSVLACSEFLHMFVYYKNQASIQAFPHSAICMGFTQLSSLLLVREVNSSTIFEFKSTSHVFPKP